MATARKLRRRMSVDEVNADLLGHVHETIERLGALWDQVSMDQEMRIKRTESAYKLFYNTMNDIVMNEEEMVKGVREDIDRDLADVSATRQQLSLHPFPVDKYKPYSIDLLKALGKDKKQLEERKAQAMARQLEEYNGLVELCQRLGEPIPQYESVEERIMPKAKVDEIEKTRSRLRKEFESRKSAALDYQTKANRRHIVVRNVTLDDGERELLSMDLNAVGTVFTAELLQRFTGLLSKFEAEYENWRNNIVFTYMEHYAELSSLAEKCYATSILSNFPDSIDLDVHDESIVNEIRQELEILRKRYEAGRSLFDSFAQWHSCFRKQDEIEAEFNTDRARKNRGGYLNVLTREQKKNNANCARYLKELQLACEKSADDSITIEGLSPYDFAQSLIQDREQQKENEKQIKKFAKKQQLHVESKFGASGSPLIKPANGSKQFTPGRTPMSASTPVSLATPSRKRLLGRD